MIAFLIGLAVNGVAIWVASELIPGISLTFPAGETLDKVLYVGVIALIFTLVNMIVKPIVKVLSLPLTIITLGLFSLVISALMLLLTGWIAGKVGYGLVIDGFLPALLGAIVIALVAMVLHAVLPGSKRR